MAFKAKITANLQLWQSTSTERSPYFNLDEDDASESWTDLEHFTSGRRTIAAGASEALPFGDVASGTAILIIADGEFTVELNGDGVDREVGIRGTGAAARARYLTTETCTSATVTNPAATDALIVEFCIIGDPA